MAEETTTPSRTGAGRDKGNWSCRWLLVKPSKKRSPG